VQQLPLPGPGAARCRPPRSWAWLSDHRRSYHREERPAGTIAPLPSPPAWHGAPSLMDGRVTADAVRPAVTRPPMAGLSLRPATTGEGDHCGSPPSSQEPPRAEGAEIHPHLHDLVRVQRGERGRLPTGCEGEPSTNAGEKRRRRPRPRRTGKPSTGERRPEAEHSPGL
jgi:hypothetical protein